MKKASATLSLAFDARRANLPQVIIMAMVLSVVVGLLLTDTMDEMVAYLVLAFCCALPVAIWIQVGAAGIPVFPAVSALSFIYYALPILRRNSTLSEFGPSEILSAAITVSLFLASATVSWLLLLVSSLRQRRSADPELISQSRLIQVMFFGLASGIFYHIAIYASWLDWLGPAFGLVRSVMLTIATAACFILGHARARGLLRGQNWALAAAGMGMMIVLSWGSLLLVTGILFCLVAMFGYVITSKRVPWRILSVAAAVIIVFHAGKDSIREKYWFARSNYGARISATEVPGLMLEWAGNGLTTIVSGSSYESAIDRASLLNLLMNVQRVTPDYVPFLGGETYALLPQMLVPRFVDPDKITSQMAMNMLNVRYGFLSEEGTLSTAVGWGFIAEAYANFGRLGVIGVGLVFGFLTGFFGRWSVGAPLISLPSLVAVTALMQFVNMEGDAAAVLTALFQSIVSIAIFFWSLEVLSKKRKRLPKRISARG